MQENGRFNSEPFDFQVLTELSEIAAQAEEWDSLLQLSTCNRAFSSAEWFTASCRHNPSLRPYVVIARRGSALAGILPLVLTHGGRVATFPNYLTDYNDTVAPRDDLAVVSSLLNYVRSLPNGYKRVVLSHIRRDSNCLRAIEWSELRGLEKSFREIVTCQYLRLPASHNDFLSSKDSRFRKRLKRLHCFAGQSNLTVRELAPDNFSPDSLPEAFLSLHLERQKVKSCFAASSAQSFVREIVPELFKRKSVRACALVEGERIAAIDLYTMGSNSLCAWNGGFLSAVAHCSPGKLLIEAGIKLACALRLEEFDFMRGPESYKTSWSNGSRAIGQLEFTVAKKTQLSYV